MCTSAGGRLHCRWGRGISSSGCGSSSDRSVNRTRKGSFGGHAALSLTAAVLAAAITVATLPFIVSRLGLPSYGLLSLLFVATAYAGILDFGFSWTSARFIADALERGDRVMLDGVVRASAALYVAVGLLGGTVLAVTAEP